MSRQPYAGVYENMDFKPYVFQEYPKHVGKKEIGGGKFAPIIAESQRHELELLATGELDLKVNALEQGAKDLLSAENEVLKAKMAELEAKLEALLKPKDTPKAPESLAALTKKG